MSVYGGIGDTVRFIHTWIRIPYTLPEITFASWIAAWLEYRETLTTDALTLIPATVFDEIVLWWMSAHAYPFGVSGRSAPWMRMPSAFAVRVFHPRSCPGSVGFRAPLFRTQIP